MKTIQKSDSNYLAWASKWDVEILQVLLELCSKDECKLCDKKFHDSKKVFQYLVASGIMKFECELCSKRFVNSNSTRVQERAKHSIVKNQVSPIVMDEKQIVHSVVLNLP